MARRAIYTIYCAHGSYVCVCVYKSPGPPAARVSYINIVYNYMYTRVYQAYVNGKLKVVNAAIYIYYYLFISRKQKKNNCARIKLKYNKRCAHIHTHLSADHKRMIYQRTLLRKHNKIRGRHWQQSRAQQLYYIILSPELANASSCSCNKVTDYIGTATVYTPRAPASEATTVCPINFACGDERERAQLIHTAPRRESTVEKMRCTGEKSIPSISSSYYTII